MNHSSHIQDHGITNPLPYAQANAYGSVPLQNPLIKSNEDFNIPFNELQQVPGYTGISFETTPTAPPPDLPKFTAPHERSPLLPIPHINEEQAREAALNFAAEKCCYGTKTAREMIVNDVNYKSAFHYTLETFAEKRETSRAFVPYRGTPVSVGYAPLPWEVPVNPKGPFKNDKVVVEIPNTEEIRTCHRCSGLGHRRCTRCLGAGEVSCSFCHGTGRKPHSDGEHCHHCHSLLSPGRGMERCYSCHGRGHVTCNTCEGKTQLRFFIQLTVTWTNHIEDHISDTATFPKELIREVSGQVAIEERYPKVWPVTQFPDAGVNMASQRIISKHEVAFPLEKVLEQRQRVRIVPIAEVTYRWRETTGHFHVYGFETRVYFPDYPQSYCWGCNIL